MIRTSLMAACVPLLVAHGQGTPPLPISPSSISDPSGLLSRSERSTLDARIDGIRSARLGEVGVAIVRRIGARSGEGAAAEVLRAWRSDGRRLDVLLLIATDSAADGSRPACGAAGGGGDELARLATWVSESCRFGVLTSVNSRQYARAISGGLVLIENRLRTRAGLGLAGPAPRDSGARAPRDAPPAPVRAPASAAPISSAPAPKPQGVPVNGLAWMLGSFVAFAGIALAVVSVRNRASAARRKCVKCGRIMEEASETTRARLLDDAQEREELLGNARYVVWACRCGQTRVQAIRR